MITEEEKVKILDFGLAKALADEIQSVDSSQSPTITEAMTQPGVILGTAAYMSPEQAKGKAVDKRADIWAFGCILYECLTGKKVFGGETVTETLAAVIRGEPDFEKTPAKTRLLLRQCLIKDPKNRLRDIGDAMAWIENAPETVEREPGPLSRPWLAWSVAAVLLIALSLIAFVRVGKKAVTLPELIRYRLDFPDDVTPLLYGSFVLSPDGRRLSIPGIGPDGINRLWIRSLDSLETQPLHGTESNVYFFQSFWSSDGRYIAFDAGGTLKKILASGGPAHSICPLSGGASGGSWNDDDVIIFGDYQASNGILGVSAAGGTPLPVTKPNAKRQEFAHIYPVFLPDNRHFLYFCSSAIPENTGIYAGSIDLKPEDQNANRLVPTSGQAVYVPPIDSDLGYLLFLQGETLVAQTFDDKKLKPVGDPIPVADRVGFTSYIGFFTASRNGVLIYRPPVANKPTWIDRSGKELGTIGEPGDYSTFDLSKDGNWFVASKTEPDGHENLWVIDLLRGPSTRLTLESASDMDPRWSPDGNQVMYGSPRDIFNVLLQVSWPASEPEEIFQMENASCYLDDWSPDGKYLLYHNEIQSALYALPLSGEKKPIQVARSLSGTIDQSQFSPDGRWIAYNTNESGRHEVKAVPFPATRGPVQISKSGGVQPTWSSKGDELYFLAPDGKLMAVDIQAGEKLEFGEPRELFGTQLPPSSGTEQYAPHPDGKLGKGGMR